MEQGHALRRAATEASVRPLARLPCRVLCLLALMPPVIGADAQTLTSANPHDLLKTDAATFARLLESIRPVPVSAELKAHILTTLPEEGVVTSLDPVAMRKLEGVTEVLRTVKRDTVYDVRVVDVGQAAVALHARTVLLISKPALDLLDAAELPALAAHEVGHEYVWDEYDRASKAGDDPARQELELLCDAIGIVILGQLRMDTSRLMTAVEKMARFNRERFGTALNENAYPTVSRRRQFARAVREWVAAGGPARQHGPENATEPAAGCEGRDLRLDVVVMDTAGTPSPVLDQAGREVAGIWSAGGIRLEWEVARAAVGRPDRLLVPVVIWPKALHATSGPHRAERLGWAAVDATGRATGVIEISLPSVVSVTMSGEYLGKRVSALAPPVQEYVVGRALGRVIAHEIGHWLFGPGHTGDGVMIRALDANTLATGGALALPRAWTDGAGRLIARPTRCHGVAEGR